MKRHFDFPEGKKFAFTIIDDTDVATVDNVAPVYALLRDLGLRTTKTVWPLDHDDPTSNYVGSETLQDAEYVRFVRELQGEGFEVTWHSATMESSVRPRILEALTTFESLLGHFPRIHVSHAENRENPYWGIHRVDMPLVRWILKRGVRPASYYQGHEPESEFWWGDYCSTHIEYGRNLTFNGINLAAINPTMPYRDPKRPLVSRWFSASDAEDATAFRRLLSSTNQERLEREGGFCIVATHFGKSFTRQGRVDPGVRIALEELAARPGWFPTAGQLLDWLQDQHGAPPLTKREWRRMQLRFVLDGMRRRFHSTIKRRWKVTRVGRGSLVAAGSDASRTDDG